MTSEARAATRLSRPVRFLIYDLDGVLLDTEPYYTEATQEVVSEFGKTFDWSVKRNMIGRPSLESARYLVTALALPISAEEYLRRRSARLEALFLEAREIAGAERFTRRMHALGIHQAVATSSERRLLELKTRRHQDWFAIFEAIVSGDDDRVKAGKPAPDIFLVAAAALGADPCNCLVFEDSPAGLEAAHRAGMQVVAVPDPAMEIDRFRTAEMIIESFEDLEPCVLGL